ncbi:MAG: ATP-binding protein [Armatimonadetes bacterium]|nr:ATP-binding protein [Armatimonadota bacterium]
MIDPSEKQTSELTQVGRVVATEQKPNTAYEFHFWTAVRSPVGIGTLVLVETSDVTVYGVVVEGWSFTDLASPLYDYIGLEGDPTTQPMTQRPEIRCYTAAVLRIEPEEPVQPVPVGPVYLADDAAVTRALRSDGYAEKTGVAVGAYQNGDIHCPVYLDAEFLLGPEAAHVNLTGVSGLATKTSSIEFLLQSIFASNVPEVACVCFNVKGHDMLFLDHASDVDSDHALASRYEELEISGLAETDRALYDALKVPCQPFANVRYFAPYKEDGYNLNTLRNNLEISGNVAPLAWGLTDVFKFAEVVLNRDDVDAKADALIQFINQQVINAKNGFDIGDNGPSIRVQTFADLERWFERVMKLMEGEGRDKGQDQYRTHHIATIRKVHNRLSNLVTRYKGLLVGDENRADLPWGSFEDRTVYVIDIAGMDAQGQDLVVTRVVNELREHLEKKTLGVEKCIVVVDELNKYAPSDGPETYLKKTLLEISERGRYLGLVLFSAQQFRSQVHKRIVGNSGTSIYGRMDMDELATPGYQVLTRAEREKLATLSKGQLMVRHPHFSQAIFVKFPRPNVLRGADGVRLFPTAADMTVEEVIFQEFKRLNPAVQRNQVREAVEQTGVESALEAFNRVKLGRPEDPMEAFRNTCRKRADRQQPGASTPHGFGAPAPVSLDDPFAD